MNTSINTQPAITSLLKSKTARSYVNKGKKYKLDLVYDKENSWIDVTTWGYDYEGFTVPRTRPELIKLRTMYQLEKMQGRLTDVGQVALRFYLSILRNN